ncbi:hypothetical protein [Pseudomonas saponiphila]|uniref:hypothetical protein n=1 Tax=Pseudomonas saponiphila TaxID=556534 RepID=UPI0022409415|nr:hypothetical protein [Pseudomonas saponiphila]
MMMGAMVRQWMHRSKRIEQFSLWREGISPGWVIFPGCRLRLLGHWFAPAMGKRLQVLRGRQQTHPDQRRAARTDPPPVKINRRDRLFSHCPRSTSFKDSITGVMADE